MGLFFLFFFPQTFFPSFWASFLILFFPPLLIQAFFEDLLCTYIPPFLLPPFLLPPILLPTHLPPSCYWPLLPHQFCIHHHCQQLQHLGLGFTCELKIRFSLGTFWDWSTWARGMRSLRNVTNNLKNTLKIVKLQEFHQPLQGKFLLIWKKKIYCWCFHKNYIFFWAHVASTKFFFWATNLKKIGVVCASTKTRTNSIFFELLMLPHLNFLSFGCLHSYDDKCHLFFVDCRCLYKDGGEHLFLFVVITYMATTSFFFICCVQSHEGSFVGPWFVCFTYISYAYVLLMRKLEMKKD
jgi:hypothetical protein